MNYMTLMKKLLLKDFGFICNEQYRFHFAEQRARCKMRLIGKTTSTIPKKGLADVVFCVRIKLQ